jgi:FtsP/CotA-like multicopper oxidase with cupredoxin domain
MQCYNRPTIQNFQRCTSKELKFTLTGNMNRYVWSMDNKILSEVDKIPVKREKFYALPFIITQ